MSILYTYKQKMTLPWFIRAIVASAGIFREILVVFVLFCLFMRTVLEKWVVSFMHGVVGSGLLRLWLITQVYARKYGKWFFEIEVYQVYARNFGFFCSLEKIEDDGLAVKTHWIAPI